MSEKEIFDYLTTEEKKDLVEFFEELKNAQSTKSVRMYSSKIRELLDKIEQRMLHSREEAATIENASINS
ncbi:hypothetical protein AB1284_25325 [Bacillus sp. S2(2024)]|uniref:hypothetical protein n=1 Tax=Bacillus sp. S2(2024) TaxID=3162887 RepID=UPI003D20B5D1